MTDMSARVVIIGGGAVGASCLYHLAKAGWTDCILLEKNELTSGSTWHAAGNCPNFSASWSVMKMQAYSTALYRELGDLVDYPMNYHVNGAIRLAHDKERMREFEHVTAMGRSQGVDFEMLSIDDMKSYYPYLETHDLVGGQWDPYDGDIDPAQLTQALAKGARDLGAKIVRFRSATGIERKGKEWIIKTDDGDVRCEYVVNAAGYRAQEVGNWFIPFGGRTVPMVTLAHQYLVTEQVDELTAREKKLPLLRDPDSSYYLRQEKDGLLLGPYERGGKAHWLDDSDPMPDDFSFQLYPDDLERLEWYIEDACARVPLLGTAGIKSVVNGPIPYAPDGNPLIGPMPGVPNAFEACVFTFGIVQGGGAGKILAEWVTEGQTEWDMWSVDPRRFTSFADQDYANQKGVEIYQHEYAMHFPAQTWPAARNKRLSPIHDKLAAAGAQFGPYGGWERANWYAQDGDDTSTASTQTWGREGPWLKRVREECHAVRDAAGIIDLTGFSRYRIKGDGARDWLLRTTTGSVPKPGRLSLAYFSDESGRVVTEMSVMAIEDDFFFLLTAAGAQWHDKEWLLRHVPEDAKFEISDVTDEFSCQVLTGPNSRQILADVTDTDLTKSWLTHQTTKIGDKYCQLVRVSYAGELGWEIHTHMADAAEVFDKVWQAGQSHGLKPFGMLAMDALRLEKGYRAWKQDLSTDYNIFETGLDRFTKLDKPDFVGKQALLNIKQQGVKQKFATLVVDANECDAPYLASVWQGDKNVGLVTSGGYGHRIDKSIALSVIDVDAIAPGTNLEIEIYGERVPAVVHGDAPLYDPDNSRLKG